MSRLLLACAPLVLVPSMLTSACNKNGAVNAEVPARATPADRIFTGGTIVTMNEDHPVAEALATRGGKIVEVGTNADILRWKGAATIVTDLRGRTMLPGFIDAHGHLGQLGATCACQPPTSQKSRIDSSASGARSLTLADA